MGALRDFFAAAGFCESTEGLMLKAGYIDRITRYSQKFSDPQRQFIQDSSYDERLRYVLSGASSWWLRRLIDEQVVVCLDQRLANLQLGFWDDEVLSVYYNRDRQKTLSLYDDGTLRSHFFAVSTGDYSGDAINDLVEDVLDKGDEDTALLLGTKHTTGKTTYFEWHEAEDFASELGKNPQLRQPPLKPEAGEMRLSSPGP